MAYLPTLTLVMLIYLNLTLTCQYIMLNTLNPSNPVPNRSPWEIFEEDKTETEIPCMKACGLVSPEQEG